MLYVFIFYVTINLFSLVPRGTSFVLSDKGSKTLFFVDTALIFLNIPLVRLQLRTYRSALVCAFYQLHINGALLCSL